MKKMLLTTALAGSLVVSGVAGFAVSKQGAFEPSIVADAKTSLTYAQAKKVALKKVPGGKVVKHESDYDEFEFEIRKGNYVYEVEVKKRTGKAKITDKDYEPVKKAGVKVSKAQAKKIALKKVPNGKIVSIKLDKDDGVYKYEVEIVKGNYEYELEISASSGKVLEYDRDYRD